MGGGVARGTGSPDRPTISNPPFYARVPFWNKRRVPSSGSHLVSLVGARGSGEVVRVVVCASRGANIAKGTIAKPYHLGL